MALVPHWLRMRVDMAVAQPLKNAAASMQTRYLATDRLAPVAEKCSSPAIVGNQDWRAAVAAALTLVAARVGVAIIAPA